MRKNSKRLAVLIMAITMILLGTVTSLADDTVPVAFTVELADGTITEYTAADNFADVVKVAPSGSVITLCSTVEIDKIIDLAANESSPKEITVDLAGYGIKALSKTNSSTMFIARNYTTINVTSSKPDAFLYMVDLDTNSTQGGNLFSPRGEGALINLGGAVSLKGEVYPGSNITTYSACFVDMKTGATGFNCDGGRHFSNIADWAGFICPREGDGTVTIKNADILVYKNLNLINSQESGTNLYMENCFIYNLDGSELPLFNKMLGKVTFKDCVTNYSIAAAGETSEGVITLEGYNVFSIGGGFAENLLSDRNGKTLARVNAECALTGGGTDYQMYDNVGSMTATKESLVDFKTAYAFVSSEEAYRCVWEYDKKQKSEIWYKGTVPTPPVDMGNGGVAGMYKKRWLKTVDSEDEVVYKSTYVADFGLKIQCEYADDNLSYSIYVPAFIVDEAYISFSEGKIDGSGFTSGDWVEAEIDGEKFYKYTTAVLDEERANDVIEISIPCDMFDGNKLIKCEGIWRINLSEYLEIVDKSPEKYSEEQLALIEEVRNRYFPSDESAD